MIPIIWLYMVLLAQRTQENGLILERGVCAYVVDDGPIHVRVCKDENEPRYNWLVTENAHFKQGAPYWAPE